MIRIFLIIICTFSFLVTDAQKERSLNRKGIKDYNKESYSEAEIDFLKSLEIDSSSIEAGYNLANALYRQERYEDAGKVLSGIFEELDDREKAADVLHNLGNNLLQQQMYEPSIEAYKNSLKLRPTDEETRYNLAYAKAKLKQQQQNQDQQDQQNQQDQQDQQNQQNQQDQQDQQNQQKPVELSKEDMERLLQAIAQQEKDVKEKLEKKKAAVKKVKSETQDSTLNPKSCTFFL